MSESIPTDAIAVKLHTRSDKKLRQFCESRFGDLFDMCNRHSGVRPPLADFPDVANHLNQISAKKEEFPWHGAVWGLAHETLFAMLRDQWREREIREFIAQVESVQEAINYDEEDGQ